MTEYWKSQAKKFCDFCKCWISDNKAVSYVLFEQPFRNFDKFNVYEMCKISCILLDLSFDSIQSFEMNKYIIIFDKMLFQSKAISFNLHFFSFFRVERSTKMEKDINKLQKTDFTKSKEKELKMRKSLLLKKNGCKIWRKKQ